MPSNRMVSSVVMRNRLNLRHSGAARSAEPEIHRDKSSRDFRIPYEARAPRMTSETSLLRLAGILHRLEGGEFDVVELAVDFLHLADIDVLHDVAGFRVDRDRPS